MNSKKYVLYVRTSGDQAKIEREEGYKQFILKNFARQQNLEIVASMVDYGYAKSANRPAFIATLNMLRQGGISGIICEGIDHLCRDVNTASLLLRLMYQKGVEIITPKSTFKKGRKEAQSIVGFGLLCDYYSELNRKLSRSKKLERVVN